MAAATVMSSLGYVREVGGLDDAELGIGACEREDAVAHVEARHAFAERLHGSGDVAAKDRREGDRKALLGRAGAHLPVDWIDAGGVDADQHLAGAGLGVGEVLVLQVGGRAVVVEDDAFIGSPRAIQMRVQGAGSHPSTCASLRIPRVAGS